MPVLGWGQESESQEPPSESEPQVAAVSTLAQASPLLLEQVVEWPSDRYHTLP